jgi:1,4-dihydroxy-6-naphthoate synthase
MTRRIHLGLSTCPNDTFTFHALLTGEVQTPSLEFEFELLDVEALNERLGAGDFDAAKGSFHAALLSKGELGVLPSGSALGFGNGPLLLSTEPGSTPQAGDTVLCPGKHTTASFLQRLYYPDARAEQRVFSAILPDLEAGRARFGVCIHEGRFTYADHGLHLVEDLGRRWEKETATAMPLGGIFARPHLGQDTLRSLQAAIRSSLDWARAHPEATLPTMRQYAQEFSDEVLMAHVDLYVNQWTRDLGRLGQAALASLALEGVRSGILPGGTPPLRVLGRPRLFHLCGPDAARKLLDPGAAAPRPLRPESLERDGFVHLSEEHQLSGTLETHFARIQALVLLELDADRIGAEVDWEPARGGESFPHLYREIERADVVDQWSLECGPGQTLEAPPLGSPAL